MSKRNFVFLEHRCWRSALPSRVSLGGPVCDPAVPFGSYWPPRGEAEGAPAVDPVSMLRGTYIHHSIRTPCSIVHAHFLPPPYIYIYVYIYIYIRLNWTVSIWAQACNVTSHFEHIFSIWWGSRSFFMRVLIRCLCACAALTANTTYADERFTRFFEWLQKGTLLYSPSITLYF